MPSCSKRIDAQVFGLHDDLDAVVDFGNHEDGRERRVAARLLVKRRNSHEAMDSAFAGQQAEGVFTLELDRGGFDARFFAGRRVDHHGLQAFVFRPAEIHAHEHFRPVLRFRAACARLDRHNGAQAIVFAGKERFCFQVRDENVGGGELFRHVFENRLSLLAVGFFLREMEIGVDVARFAIERGFRCWRALRAACVPAKELAPGPGSARNRER